MSLQEFRQTAMEHFYTANSVPFMINQDNCIDYSDEDVMAAEATKGKLTEVQIKIGTALRQLCADADDSVLLQKSRTDNMASVPAEQVAEKNSHDEIILSAGSTSISESLKNIISFFAISIR